VSLSDAARCVRDPTAPSALADPGLVLVRGSDRSGYRDERKGWIMTVKLTDAQLVMLSAAAQREDLCLSAPDKLKGAVLTKVGERLVKLGLVREVRAKAGMPVWRRDGAAQGYTLKLTAAGSKVIAVDDGSDEATAAKETSQLQPHPRVTKAIGPDGESPKALGPRAGSKLARVIDLLERSEGATITNLIEATGWLPHTTRAALTGLRKRGYVVARERIEEGDSIYRIGGRATDGGDRVVVDPQASEGHNQELRRKANQAA
jgi:Protein of unknown function (DUF3489)